MPAPKVRTSRNFLKGILATAFCAGLFGILFLGAGVCQTPGYGKKPDQWAPYESGQYFDRLRKIISTLHFSDRNIAFLHFEDTRAGVGPVELFRIPVGRSRDCRENECYFFVLIASDHRDAPLVTPCQFKQAALSHLFNPDGSRFFGFEFSCAEALLQVKVSPTHFMAIPVEKTP
jgi:hypothetical protein